MRDQKLFARLMYFPMDRQFLGRLCHESGWPTPFARRAIDEYKRFVYLSMVAPAPLTPPDAVDQVWRLHLLDEQSYAAMNKLLPRPLAYKPLSGRDWREFTRRFYQQELALRPPRQVWSSRRGGNDKVIARMVLALVGASCGLSFGLGLAFAFDLPSLLIPVVILGAIALSTNGFAGANRRGVRARRW